MNFDNFREYCLRKPFVSEGFPFDQTTLVFKVGGKMFALVDIERFDSINLKADPEKSIELRESYLGIQPGFHMNKKHWNSVEVNADVPEKLLLDLIDDSYTLVYNSLPKKVKNELALG